MVGSRFGIIGPVALLEDNDPHAGLGESLSGHGAGGAGADDQNIGGSLALGHDASK
jgi:hypothetical protein